MKITAIAGFLLLISLLAGCVSPPKPQQEIDRDNHQAQLAQFTHWQIKGRLAFKSSEEKFSASLKWDQKDLVYKLNLTSMIGTSLMKMEGQPGFSKLIADDKEYTDRNASRLVKRVTGWNIPVERLSVWVKGQHQAKDQISFDEYGLITSMQPQCKGCQAWQLNYSKYAQVEGIWLPHQIELMNIEQPDNQIKIRIHTWQPL